MNARGAFRDAVAIVALAATVAQPAFADTVDLPHAVDLGLKRSPELGQAQARVGAAEAGRDQATRSWFPKVDLNSAFGYRHLANDVRNLAGLSALDERPFYATIGLEQPVWDFGRRSSSAKLQGARLAWSQWDEQAASEAAAFAIARAYLQVLVQLSIVQAAQENLSFHTDLAADISEGVDKGAMSISERQQANERLQSAKVSYEQANADLGMARAELNLLVGQQDYDLTLAPNPTNAVPASLDQAIAIAATSDPRLHSSDEKYKGAKWSAKGARSEYFPTLALRGTAGAGRDFEGYRGTTRDYEILLTLRWSLFDGGVTAAKVREADRGVDEAFFAYAQAQRESELSVRKAWIGMQSWSARADTQQQRLKVARSVLESYRAQFGIGRRSLLDLLDAQNAVFDATAQSAVAATGLTLAQYGVLAQLGQLRSFFGVEKPIVDPAIYGPR